MKVSEFSAFIEGMDIEGAPTERQWEKIVEKIRVLRPDILRITVSPVTSLPRDLYSTQVYPTPYQNQLGTTGAPTPNSTTTISSSGTSYTHGGMLSGIGNALGFK
jgi:hypothetical protein